MKCIAYAAAEIIDGNKLVQGVLNVYESHCEFVDDRKSKEYPWDDLMAVNVEVCQVTVPGFLWGRTRDAVRFNTAGKEYVFVMKLDEAALVVNAIKKEKEERTRRKVEIERKAEEARQKEEARKAAELHKAERECTLLKLKGTFRSELEWVKSNIPMKYIAVEQGVMDSAVAAKRQGDYLKSIELYFAAIKKLNMITPSFARAIFKTLVAAGDVRDALAIVDYVREETQQLPFEVVAFSPITMFTDMLYNDGDVLQRLVRGKKYDEIIAFASNYSGNPTFHMSESELDIVIWEHGADILLVSLEKIRREEEEKRKAEEARRIEEDRKAKEAREAKEEREAELARRKTSAPTLRKVNSYYTKVVGVTFKNDDGSDRQRIIRDLSRNGLLNIGSELRLIHEPTNRYDRNCIQVVAMNGQQIGTLSKEQAAIVAPDMVNGRVYKAFVSSLTGGSVGYAYGINIRVEVYETAKKEVGPVQKKASTYHYSDDYGEYDIEDINSIAAGYGFDIDDDGHWVESSHNDDW